MKAKPDAALVNLVTAISAALARYFDESPNLATLNQAVEMVNRTWPDLELDANDFIIVETYGPDDADRLVVL
jgi:hypothetical protein